MRSFLKIASALLVPVALASAGCVAERTDDDADDAVASVSEHNGDGAQAVVPVTPSSPASTHCDHGPSTVAGPGGYPLPGPYACAASAGGTAPSPGYYPGYGFGSGYYPGAGYGPGYYPNSFGYGPGYSPNSFGYGPGYYPGFGYGPGYGFFAPGPQTSDPNAPCGCPAP